MPPIEILIAFFIATGVFAYMPGPAMLYATAQTIARGRQAGWLAAIGIHVGGYVHVAAAAMGLAVLFDAVPLLYMAFKFVGAAYLVWLGITMFLDSKPVHSSSLMVDAKTPKRAFWESVTVEILNPKTAIFYVAFLPQFTDSAAAFPIWLQLFILGTIVNVMFSSADVICVILADKMTKFLHKSSSSARWIKRLGGSILVGLGFNVALSGR